MPALELEPVALPYRAEMTDDEQRILRFALEAPGKVALVTLVEIRGGAARSVGAQMAVREDGQFCGYISGGCTEAAVAAEALASIDRGIDRFLKLGEGSPFFDIVLPCGGGITLAIHDLRDRRPVKRALDELAARRRTSLLYSPAQQTLSVGAYADTGWHDDAFNRSYRPQRRLALAGTGIEAATTREIATAAGYQVVDLIDTELDGDTSVAVLVHDLERELPLLELALAGQPNYIGALGSRKTHERRCEALRARGFTAKDIARIKGPIGLFGPARDASTLALSILADIAQ